MPPAPARPPRKSSRYDLKPERERRWRDCLQAVVKEYVPPPAPRIPSAIATRNFLRKQTNKRAKVSVMWNPQEKTAAYNELWDSVVGVFAEHKWPPPLPFDPNTPERAKAKQGQK